MFRFSICVLALALGRFAELGASEDASVEATDASDESTLPITDDSSISATPVEPTTVEPTTEAEEEAAGADAIAGAADTGTTGEQADPTSEEPEAAQDASEEAEGAGDEPEEAEVAQDASEEADVSAVSDSSEEVDTAGTTDADTGITADASQTTDADATADSVKGKDVAAAVDRTLTGEAAAKERLIFKGDLPDLPKMPDEIHDGIIFYLQFLERQSLQSSDVPEYDQGAWEYGDLRRIKTMFAIPCAQACEDDEECHHWNFNVVNRMCDLKGGTGGLNTIPSDWLTGSSSRAV